MKKLFYILTLWVVIGSCKKEEQDDLSVHLVVPSAFRPSSPVDCPSGDAYCNRRFKVTIVNPNNVDYRMELTIFNNQQENVYKTSYTVVGWDGTVRNEGTTPCPQGSYHYLIKITEYPGEKSKLFEGTVLLLR